MLNQHFDRSFQSKTKCSLQKCFPPKLEPEKGASSYIQGRLIIGPIWSYVILRAMGFINYTFRIQSTFSTFGS